MSTTEAVIETPALQFTDAAARKVGDLIRGEGNPNLMLRVFVQGGGCSGLQYGFEFDEQGQDGDTCGENLGVKLLVDPMSVQYLTGAEIDYREGLEGAPFVNRTPQAPTPHGCGASFSAKRASREPSCLGPTGPAIPRHKLLPLCSRRPRRCRSWVEQLSHG